jgi:hypothetical protein
MRITAVRALGVHSGRTVHSRLDPEKAAAGRSEGHDPLQLNPAVELGCGRADHCQQRLLEQHGKRTRGAVGVRQLGGESLAPGR